MAGTFGQVSLGPIHKRLLPKFSPRLYIQAIKGYKLFRKICETVQGGRCSEAVSIVRCFVEEMQMNEMQKDIV
jgi:hypothetical protein